MIIKILQYLKNSVLFVNTVEPEEYI